LDFVVGHHVSYSVCFTEHFFPIHTEKIGDSAIITTKLADGSVTSAKILDGTINAVDISDGAIVTIKVANFFYFFNKNS
jgi:hypothetical protein